jgi:ribonuclease VapC
LIVDTSILVAVLTVEPDWRQWLDELERFAVRRISAGNFLEAGIVLSKGKGGTSRISLDRMVDEFGIEIAAVTAEHARLARDAYRRFGKGNHPARLNFGDCFAYALSKATGEPLLFKGGDFAQTDVDPAVSPGASR